MRSVVIALEHPAVGTATCSADYGRSDFFVAPPDGATRSKPLNVETDGERTHLEAADPPAAVSGRSTRLTVQETV